MHICLIINGEKNQFPIEENWTVHELKRRIRSEFRIPVHQQHLVFVKRSKKWFFKLNKKKIPLENDNRPLLEYGIRLFSRILLCQSNVPTRVNVIDEDGACFHCDFEEPLPKIPMLKEAISQKIQLPVCQIQLFFQGKELGGDVVSCTHLFNHKVEHESTVFLKRLREQIPIIFKDSEGNEVEESFWLTATITDLNKFVDENMSIPIAMQRLIYRNHGMKKRLQFGTLTYNELRENSVVYVESLSKTMQIYVNEITGTPRTIDVYPDMSVEDFKLRFQNRFNIPIHQQRFIFNGKQLEDGRTLSDYNIQKDSTLHLIMRLFGC